MKKYLFSLLALGLLFASCDKVEDPYPAGISQGSYDLYPDGDSAHYAANAWPTFSANPNTNRNVLIEDYTGHQCTYCADAAEEAELIKTTNSGRVVVMAVHASPNGVGSFQETSEAFPTVFYNYISEALGMYFGNDWPGSLFAGNPFGSISRKDNGNGTPMEGPSSWANSTASILSTNDHKVNIQAASNYYPSTKGLFLHTEIDVLDQNLTNELRVVAYLIENEFVAPQKLSNGTTDYNYVHHDILRASIDGSIWGQILDVAHEENGKYYFNYIYEMPEGYDNSNSHLVIFVRDAVTEEVYHVIKHEF